MRDFRPKSFAPPLLERPVRQVREMVHTKQQSRRTDEYGQIPRMDSHKELHRIEAFSDGVFAIAATLLILEIKVPHLQDMESPRALWPALRAEWPSFMAFVISFVTLLVAWAGHHRGVSTLVRSSKTFLFANGFLLLTITFLPFPTAVLAEYLLTPQANIAAVFYCAAGFALSLAFNVWWRTAHWPVKLVSPSFPKSEARKASVQLLSGLVFSAITTLVAYWFPMIGVTMIFLLEFLWVTVAIGSKEDLEA
jgi:uncharacterized membrane protein